MNSDENKIRLISDFDIVPEKNEKAQINGVSIPVDRQPDLLYLTSILVSSGPNLNGAFFMPSELAGARGTIIHKAADVLHEEQEVVGHIIDHSFVTKDKRPFDPVSLMQAKGDLFNKETFDIATLSVVYKLRFPEVAQDILNGRFKVSMECFYEDFDIMLPGSDFILSADEAVKNGLVELIGKQVKVVDGNERQVDKVFRVLRNMVFSGFGFVDNPANPESVIMETANINEDKLPVIDLNKIESYRKMKQEKNKLEVSSEGSNNKAGESEGAERNFVAPTSSTHDALCVSFKRYVHAGNPQAGVTEVTRENYCALFDLDCPVAGSSTDVGCWRNVFNRTVREEITGVLDKLLNERTKVVFTQEGLSLPDWILIKDSVTENDNIIPVDFEELIRVMEKESMFTKEFDSRTLAKSLRDVETAVKKADDYLAKNSKAADEWFYKNLVEEAAPKSTKSINDLPDSSFAVIEPAYKSGKVKNKSARHLPHHDMGGGGSKNVNLDLPRLRNAFARVNQIKPVSDSISKEELVRKGRTHLENHRGALKTSKK